MVSKIVSKSKRRSRNKEALLLLISHYFVVFSLLFNKIKWKVKVKISYDIDGFLAAKPSRGDEAAEGVANYELDRMWSETWWILYSWWYNSSESQTFGAIDGGEVTCHGRWVTITLVFGASQAVTESDMWEQPHLNFFTVCIGGARTPPIIAVLCVETLNSASYSYC